MLPHVQVRVSLSAILSVLLLGAPGFVSAQPRSLNLGVARDAPEQGARKVQGILNVVWGDPRPGTFGLPTVKYLLTMDRAPAIELAIPEDLVVAAGGARALAGTRVEVLLEPLGSPRGDGLKAADAVVRSLQFVDRVSAKNNAKAVIGAQPWVSILCKFADVAAEPKPLSYFQWMYASSYPGLDNYWREISYDKVNVTGSTAVAWVTMPYPVSHYASPSGGDTSALLNDCTMAADPYVYFPSFVGINMMFNDEFGPYAWGGSQWLSRDGVSKVYRVTWEPPWGYANAAVIAHEMGHGFGLPHSNNADGDGYPYDNPWDVMSDSWNFALSHPTYGTLGKGTIAYHRDLLGWIDSARKLTIDSPGTYQHALDHLSLQSTDNLRLIRIVQPESASFYTVEVRDKIDYDGKLPDFAVVIHEVDQSRREDAWLVDIEDVNNGADEGAMWRVGECFEDEANQIRVCVQSVTTEGFVVQVSYGVTDTLFNDGFEGSNTNAWSSTVP